MNADQLVDRLTSLYDVTETRAVAILNERLAMMVVRAKYIRAIKTLGTTVADQTSYSLDSTVAKILEAKVVYSADGQVNYKGDISLQTLWDLDSGEAEVTADSSYPYWVVIEPDSDSSGTTDNLRLYPAPGESGKTITGLVVLRPDTITYGSSTALPIPEDVHPNLLAGCKADLEDENDRQDQSAKFEGVFNAGINELERQVGGRATSGGRMKMRGYDLAR